MKSDYCGIEYPIELTTVDNTLCGDMQNIHYHDSYEIYILEKGKRSYLIGSTFIKVNPGDVAFIKPYEIHTTGGESYRRHLVSFKEAHHDCFFTEEAKRDFKMF